MYWAKLSKATVIKTYESQTCSNINWQVHGITNGKKPQRSYTTFIQYKISFKSGLRYFQDKAGHSEENDSQQDK